MPTRGEVLYRLNQPECEETLQFENRLADYIFRARAKFENKFARLGRQPNERERDDFEMWVDMFEETSWDAFLSEG